MDVSTKVVEADPLAEAATEEEVMQPQEVNQHRHQLA